MTQTQELSELKIDVDLANREENEASTSSEVTPSNPEDEKRYRKTIRLTSDQLKKLNLKRGMNEVEFSVTTAFQGTTRCMCHIYLWHHTDKVSFQFMTNDGWESCDTLPNARLLFLILTGPLPSLTCWVTCCPSLGGTGRSRAWRTSTPRSGTTATRSSTSAPAPSARPRSPKTISSR